MAELGIDADELGKKVGAHRVTIQRILSGTTTSTPLLDEIRDVLKLSGTGRLRHVIMATDEMEVMTAYRTIKRTSPEKAEEFLKAIAALAAQCEEVEEARERARRLEEKLKTNDFTA